MSEETKTHFAQLVLMMHDMAWQQLGKTANPITGKPQRNLEGAKFFIDVLGALEEKTKGNLSDEESQLLSQILSTLRLNYVDEANKPDEPEADGDQQKQTETETASKGKQEAESGSE
jgi:hypothetical protein